MNRFTVAPVPGRADRIRGMVLVARQLIEAGAALSAAIDAGDPAGIAAARVAHEEARVTARRIVRAEIN